MAETIQSRRLPTPDWDTLTFAYQETDEVYQSLGDSERNPVWDEGRFRSFSDLTLHPSAAFLSYGQGIFEGLKARRSPDGRILLFRPDRNARRFAASARRLAMDAFPEDQFVRAVEELVRRNERFVPPGDKGSFYVRPTQHAIEPRLGLGPCKKFWVNMLGCPVGAYFRGKPRAVRLRVLEQGRVAPGGTGSAKAIGNYAGAIWVAKQWQEKGYDDVLYLDARHVRYLTETSGSNPVVVLEDGTLVTPPLDDQILPGVTRESALQLAREMLGRKVEERPISIEEVLDRGREFFCTGTAWTLQSVDSIDYRDQSIAFPGRQVRDQLFELLLGIQSGEREDPFGWVREVPV